MQPPRCLTDRQPDLLTEQPCAIDRGAPGAPVGDQPMDRLPRLHGSRPVGQLAHNLFLLGGKVELAALDLIRKRPPNGRLERQPFGGPHQASFPSESAIRADRRQARAHLHALQAHVEEASLGCARLDARRAREPFHLDFELTASRGDVLAATDPHAGR